MRTFASTASVISLLTTLATFQAASANAAILWVMVVGTDDGTCGTFPSPFHPCRTLQQAVTNAQAGDTIIIDVPGDYGPATINKSLDIFARSLGAGTYSPSGVPCLTITGLNTIVSLSQYTCDQGGAAQPGIKFVSGKALYLDNVSVQNGTGAACGVAFQTSKASVLSIRDSTISNFGTIGNGGGVCVIPASGGSVKGWLTNVELEANRYGVLALAAADRPVKLGVDGGRVTVNTNGLRASGAGATILARNNTISGNNLALSHVSSAKLESLGGNAVLANTQKGTFTATWPQQ